MISSDRLELIGAQTIDGAFGLNDGMPWPRTALRKDMARFKYRTTLAPEGKKNLLIAGRDTFEAMGSTALPNRYMAVISSKYKNVEIINNDVFCAPSIPSILSFAETLEDLHHIFFIGGETIWKEGFPLVSSAHTTLVHRNIKNQEGLRRLELSLHELAIKSGLPLLGTISNEDEWDGTIRVDFVEYRRPVIT